MSNKSKIQLIKWQEGEKRLDRKREMFISAFGAGKSPHRTGDTYICLYADKIGTITATR